MKGPPSHWTTLKKLIYLKAARGSSPSWAWQLLTGTAPLTLLDAVAHGIHSLTQYGLCVQDGTPTPDAPVDIVCNNGAIKVRRPSGMPIAYQMVEWLKPAGTIIITGFKTKSTQEIEAAFYRERSGACYLYSSDTATGGTTNTTAYITSGAGNWRWDGKFISINVPTATQVTSIQDKDGVWLNGLRYGVYSDAGDFVSTNDLRLSSYENTTIRIYAMTIREGETVTLDLVPVQRVSDSTYGFYDKVSGNFYTNPDATFEAGDPIPDPVEIYTDGTPEVLTISGINLLDPSTRNIIIGEFINEQGQSVKVTNNWRTDYIPVVGGETYIFYGRRKSDDVISAYCRINFYTADKTAITPRPSYKQNTPTVATAPSNAAYVRLSSAPHNSSAVITRETFDKFNWMFAESSAEIPYEPYVAPQTVTVPMLLGVGDYKDAAELISGIKTGKVGIKVLDGGADESWGYSQTSGVDRMNLALSDMLPANYGSGLCTHLKRVSSVTEGIRFGASNSALYVYLNPTRGFNSAALWKAFLAAQYAAGTPVIVIYPRANEQTEQGTPHALNTTQGTNVVDVTAAVSPVQLSVEYAKQSA